MGQRSRKRGRRTRAPGSTAARPAAAAPPPVRRRASAEERNATLRADLVPLAPGERPWPIVVSVVVAAVLGGVNLALFLAGVKPHVGGQQPKLPEILIFSALMFGCAIGMWFLRYQAVLGFQTLLAIGILGFFLALVRAATIPAALICIVVIAGGGFLFFKLVRVLSRLQMPKYPGSS